MTTAPTEDELRDQCIRDYRLALQENVQSAIVVVTRARGDRAILAADHVYDVEHAENADSALADRFLSQADDALRAAAAIISGIHRASS